MPIGVGLAFPWIAMPWVAHMPGLAAAPVVGADGIIEFAVFEIAVRK